MWSSTPRLILGLYGLLCAVGSASADVDFMSVRPDMVKDYSGKGGEPGEKYFSKSGLVLRLLSALSNKLQRNLGMP